jgi:hypothetical protein
MRPLWVWLAACDGGPAERGECSTSFFADGDADGHGDPAVPITACSVPGGFAATHGDCDDQDATIHPDAEEICNARDDDCNGTIDDGLEALDWFEDADDDGFGKDPPLTTSCAQPPGTVAVSGDCDDTDEAVSPEADELCNDHDDDCDALVDALDPDLADGSLWYADVDLDHYGDPATEVVACEQPPELVSNAMDCDDANAAIHPDADEICDTIDNDCDSLADDDDSLVTGGTTFYADGDGDGYGGDLSSTTTACALPDGYAVTANDCYDGDPDVGAPLHYYSDADEDGYGSGAGITTCTPTGLVVLLDGDCEPNDEAINPGATEICNGVDDNCDDLVDLDDPLVDATIYGDADGDGYGADADAILTCDETDGYVEVGGDCDDGDDTVNPGELEYCDAIDNDCNGAIDDSVGYVDWYADTDGDGFGNASETVSECAPLSGYVLDASDCDDASDTTYPGATELCVNDTDDNCDGTVDNCVFPLEEADALVHGIDPDVSWEGIGAILTASDLDADGTSDLLLGSGEVNSDRGRVYVVHGPTSGTTLLGEAVTISGTARRGYFGGGLGAGDADGDGAADLAVAAVERDVSMGEDAVYLFLGPVTADRDADDADAYFAGADESVAGANVDIVSDVDGDATPDIVIGAPAGGSSGGGQVYVVSGGSSGSLTLATDATYIYDTTSWFDRLGNAGADFGDANGDGVGDLALTASSSGTSAGGAAHIVDGGAAAGTYDVEGVAATTITNAGDGSIHSLAAADYDNDGAMDLLLADVYADGVSGEMWAGAVYGFLAPFSSALTTADADVTWLGVDSSGALGSALEVGDVDGDKNVDVLFGAPEGGPDHRGAAYLQFGMATGTVDVATLLSFPGHVSGQAGVGAGVTMIPDWTGDDGAEVAIGAPQGADAGGAGLGTVYIFFSDHLF